MIKLKFYFTVCVIIILCTATTILADYKSNEFAQVKDSSIDKKKKDDKETVIIDNTASKQKTKSNDIKKRFKQFEKLTPKQKEIILTYQKKINSEIIDQGICGDYAYWILQGDGILRIFGKYKIYDYSEDGSNAQHSPRPWDEYRADIKNIVIEEGITWIGMLAFYRLYKLENVKIARSVKVIAWNVFGDCHSLKTLYLPNSVEFFHNPGKELEIKIEGGIEAVSKGKCGDNAKFQFNKKKGELIIYGYGNITHWQSKWTLYKPLIKKVYIADKISNISNDAFTFCNKLENIRMSNNITKIGDWAFNGCASLKSIILPKNLTTIGKWAFCGCNGLSKVRIPNKVTEVGEYAFSACNNIVIEAPIHLKGKMKENNNVTIRYY